jgi:leucyl aminopeptidase
MVITELIFLLSFHQKEPHKANMQDIINAENTGIDLHIFTHTDFNTWLPEQSEQVKNWLNHTDFSGSGLSIIPSSDGTIDCVIMVVSTPDNYFVLGDIINQLPAKQYRLNAPVQHQQALVFGWALGGYCFDHYVKNKKVLPILAVGDEVLVNKVNNLVQATYLVRDLINTPAGDMMPEQLAQSAKALVSEFGGEVNQLIGEELLAHNYPTIHAVGRASIHQPQLIDLRWGKSSDPLVTLVGKGVCFDSGGLDLKPASGMRFMKKDMGGAAHVLGLARLIMSSQLPINLRVLVPAVENAVSNNAFRPGDVITTRSGLKVEIDNTDAEGRLVLCDALTEAENDQPELLIDFATLTGAMRVALGTELPGFFSTNDKVAEQLITAGNEISDPIWRMPLHQAYKDLLRSQVADISNCASVPFGGAITAALYLQEFVKPQTDWLHFDVMAWNNRVLPGRPIGGEAFGIRAVFNYLEQRYNNKA